MKKSVPSLGQLIKKASLTYQDKVAFDIKRGFRTQRFTFSQVWELSLKLACLLQKEGIRQGERVVIWSPNMPEYALSYFGIWLAGAVAVPIDVRTSKETLKHFLKLSSPKLAFVSKLLPDFSFSSLKVYFLEDLTEILGSYTKPSQIPKVTPKDIAEIAFTSGTTGLPKGVILTHGNFLADVDNLLTVFPFSSSWRALSLLPLSHAFAQVVDLLSVYTSGVKMSFPPRINPRALILTIQKEKITSMSLTPQILRTLLAGIERRVEQEGKEKSWQLAHKIAPFLPCFARRLLFKKVMTLLGGHLQFFGCGSAPLELKLAQAWQRMGVEIFEGYGATETTAAATINTSQNKKLGSVGKPLPHTQIRISPSREIEVRGANVSPGYWQNPQKTKSAFQNDWYKTGDIGFFDKEGFLSIVGRDVFKIVLESGQKVYVEDVERTLNNHPQVVESCVLGIKRNGGEIVHAVLLLKRGTKIEEIIREVNQQLEAHQQILAFSVWPQEDFPRTPIFKIDRLKVKEWIESKTLLAKKIVSPPTEDPLVKFLAQISGVPPASILPTSNLGSDLGLDSLGRVQLVSMIEEELGVVLEELEITPQTTVRKLRNLIKKAPSVPPPSVFNFWTYSWPAIAWRTFLQKVLIFPLYSLFVPLKIVGKENLKNLPLPALFYFNHLGIYDALAVIQALPFKIRQKLAVATLSHLWQEWRGAWVEILAGGYPFHRERNITESFQLTGELVDRGFSVLIAPEGKISHQGKLLPLKPGAGFLAVEMQLPLVPCKISEDYIKVFPDQFNAWTQYLPKGRKKVTLAFGKPLYFSKNTNPRAATKKMRQALVRL